MAVVTVRLERQLTQVAPRATALSWGQHGPTVEGIPSVRSRDTAATHGIESDVGSSRSRVPRAGCQESEQTRAEAQGYTARRFPRPWRLVRARLKSLLARQGLVGESLAHDAADRHAEAVGVVHVLPVVVAKRLFIQIPEQVERFDTDIRAGQPALEQAPVVLQPVGVDLSVHIAARGRSRCR